MKKIKSKYFFAALTVGFTLFTGCTENIGDSSRYVFKESVIADYLKKHEQYSEYYKLLGQVPVSPMSETTCLQILSARGHYTVFVPTNDAIQKYLQKQVDKKIVSQPSWDAFTDEKKKDSVKMALVYNSIIDSGDNKEAYETASFPVTQDAEIVTPNMNDRKVSIHYLDDPDSILISDCVMDPINHDILAINGVVHAMEDVIDPNNNSLGFLVSNILEKEIEGYYVMAKLIKTTGLLDTLDLIRDEKYEELRQTGVIPQNYGNNVDLTDSPEHRYYGYTLFAETDSFWTQAIGKPALEISVEDVRNYLLAQGVYPDAKNDENYESEDNLINQFVTYHLLPERLTTDHLVYHYNEKGYRPENKTLTVAMSEYYTSMGKRRLVKLYESLESQGVYINRFPQLDNRRRGNYHELSCAPENEGIKVETPNVQGDFNVRNAMIYPISKLMVYDDHTTLKLQKERIRFDVSSMWPELINNDIRLVKDIWCPPDEMYHYLENVWISPETEFVYWCGLDHGWANYQGDEMNIQGFYDVTFTLPPVPRDGVYELRYANQCGGSQRGMIQAYLGDDRDKLKVTGIPLDLRQGARARYTRNGTIPNSIGYENDIEDDDFNAEVDKKMHTLGYMKGCEQNIAGAPGGSTTMRNSDICMRYVVARQFMEANKTYYFRCKTVMDKPNYYFYMDYLELCAKEVYDNPNEPEDIW